MGTYWKNQVTPNQTQLTIRSVFNEPLQSSTKFSSLVLNFARSEQESALKIS